MIVHLRQRLRRIASALAEGFGERCGCRRSLSEGLDYLSCTYKVLGPDNDKKDLFLKGGEVVLVAGYK